MVIVFRIHSSLLLIFEVGFGIARIFGEFVPILKLATLTEFQIGDIEEMSWLQFEDKRAASWALGIFFIFVVTLIWSFASFLTQFIYADLNFRYYEYKTSFWHVCYDSFEFTRSPFILTYISR